MDLMRNRSNRVARDAARLASAWLRTAASVAGMGAGMADSEVDTAPLADSAPGSPYRAVTAIRNPFILAAMDVCLIVPGLLATVSGGHQYDRGMADGLRALGHAVRVVELGGNLPDPDQPAIYAARTVWSALPDGNNSGSIFRFVYTMVYSAE